MKSKKRRPAKNIIEEVNRHGKVVLYYREGRGNRLRLPDDYGSGEFWRAYERARSGESIPHVRDMIPTKSEKRHAEVEAVIRKAVSRARDRSTQRGLPFDLTVDWALNEVRRTNYVCPETNIPFLFEDTPNSYMRPYAPSIDRVIPANGYVTGNCRVIIFALNAMISDWGEATMHRIANGYRYVQNKRRRSIPAP